MINSNLGFKRELDDFTGELKRMDNPTYREGVYFACYKWILLKQIDRVFTAMMQIIAYGLFFIFCLAFCGAMIFAGVLLAQHGEYQFNFSLNLEGHVLIEYIIQIFVCLLVGSMILYLLRRSVAGRFQYDDWRLLNAAKNGDNGALVSLYKLYLLDRYGSDVCSKNN